MLNSRSFYRTGAGHRKHKNPDPKPELFDLVNDPREMKSGYSKLD
jgi:hypothetical protein